MNKLSKKDNWFCMCYWDSLRKGSQFECKECGMNKSDIQKHIDMASRTNIYREQDHSERYNEYLASL